MSGAEVIPDAIQGEVNRKFLFAAFEALALPVACNRFQILRSPNNPNNVVLALGGVAAAEEIPTKMPVAFVKIAAAVLFDRAFAADLAVTLERISAITPAERQAALERNPHLPPAAE
jgi:hypothetical protein